MRRLRHDASADELSTLARGGPARRRPTEPQMRRVRTAVLVARHWLGACSDRLSARASRAVTIIEREALLRIRPGFNLMDGVGERGSPA
jgi:hypothetical protein